MNKKRKIWQKQFFHNFIPWFLYQKLFLSLNKINKFQKFLGNSLATMLILANQRHSYQIHLEFEVAEDSS